MAPLLPPPPEPRAPDVPSRSSWCTVPSSMPRAGKSVYDIPDLLTAMRCWPRRTRTNTLEGDVEATPGDRQRDRRSRWSATAMAARSSPKPALIP